MTSPILLRACAKYNGFERTISNIILLPCTNMVSQPVPAKPVWSRLHGRSVHTQRAYRSDVARFRRGAGKPLPSVTLADL